MKTVKVKFRDSDMKYTYLSEFPVNVGDFLVVVANQLPAIAQAKEVIDGIKLPKGVNRDKFRFVVSVIDHEQFIKTRDMRLPPLPHWERREECIRGREAYS